REPVGVPALGATFTFATIPLPERRMVSVPPLVFSRYQKLSVYGCPEASAGENVCQMDEACVVPPLDATTCKLAFPECFTELFNVEPDRFAETVHGPGNALSKSPFWITFAPTSGSVPATSFKSSMKTEPADCR